MATTVAGVVADAILRAGTPSIFGVAGASDTPVIVAARERGLTVVLAHSVMAAATMAAITAELTDTVGIVALDAPAVSIALDRCARERSPVIFVTPPLFGLDEAAAVARVTKAVIPVSPESAGHWIAHAMHRALGIPRGPVNLEIDPAIANAPSLPIATSLKAAPIPPPSASALDEAARMLAAASRPVVVAGMLARSVDAAGWLRAFAEAMPAPVLSTPKAKGVLPDPHPLSLGLFADDSTGETLVARSDLVVAVGVDSIEAAQRDWDPGTAVLHLGSSLAEGAPYRACAEVIGDVGLIFEELAPRLRVRGRADWDVAELDRLKRSRVSAARQGALASVVSLVREAMPPGTIATTEGAVQSACARAWLATRPGEFFIPNDALASDFALPAAIATLLVHPDRRAVCFVDRNGFTTSLRALGTAAWLGLAPIVIVWTDDVAAVESSARASDLTALVARGENATGWALERALVSNTPAVIAVATDERKETGPV